MQVVMLHEPRRRGSWLIFDVRQKKFPMKTTLMLLGLVVAMPLIAADSSKILLSGSSISTEEAKATGSAKALVGDMTVTADAITFDKQKNVLKCDGAVTIRMFANLITARDCTIEVGAGEKKLFFLARGKIQIAPTSDGPLFPASPTDLIGPKADREKLLQDFQSRR